MNTKRFIIGYLFCSTLFIAITYIYGISQGLSSFLILVLYSTISFVLYIFWKKFRRQETMNYPQFFSYFIYKISIYSSLLLLTGGAFFYYQNNIFPATLPQHTISNGKQTIIFQTMSHIASDNFYKRIVEDIRGAKQDNYVLYYEGVKAGTQENNEKFNKALGVNFSPELYNNFSKLYGVRSQDNHEFLNLVNNLDYNIDLNLDDIISLYEKKIGKDTSQSTGLLGNEKVIDLNQQVISQLSQLSQGELKILRYVNQGLLNFMIKHENLRNIIISKVANQDIFSVILDDRNKHIVNEILLRKDEKIFITYGLMHFSGVLELLKSQDPNWEITASSYSQIILQGE